VKDARVVVSSSAINAPNGRSVTQISARRDSVGFELSRTLVDFANVREGQELIERILLLNTGTVALRWPRTSVTIGRFRIESITSGSLQKWNGSTWVDVAAGTSTLADGEKLQWKEKFDLD
jgi:hypothetical protein